LLFFLTLYISRSKLYVKYITSDFFIDFLICFSFLFIFLSILISASDFIIIYLAIEGVSMVLYALGSLLNAGLLNIEAVIKYFIINNLASSLFL